MDICLPTELHPTVSTAALAAGKHVLCEKPMALTEADCEAMIAAAEKAKRMLMIGQVLRFWPEYMAMQEFGAVERIRRASFGHLCAAMRLARLEQMAAGGSPQRRGNVRLVDS